MSTPQASIVTTAVAMTWLERATVDGIHYSIYKQHIRSLIVKNIIVSIIINIPIIAGVTASEGLLTQMCPPAGNKLDTESCLEVKYKLTSVDSN